MRKTISILFALALVLSFSIVTTVPVIAGPGSLEVGQPLQVTSDSNYERGQSIVYDGSAYWLFYGRSASYTGTYGSGNPDINDYVMYYKKASTVAGLATAAPVQVTGTHNANLYLGETDAAFFGGKVWAFASHYTGPNADLYAWTSIDGSSWTETLIVSGLPGGAAHFASATCGGKLWLAYKIGGDWRSKNYDGAVWSAEYTVQTSSGTAKFFVEGTDIYFVRAQGGAQNLRKWDPVGLSWSAIDSASETGAYDPTILKMGSDYVWAYAPWISPKQWIKAKVGTTLTTLLSTGSPVDITSASHGSNVWIDMWPIGFTDNCGASYLFFTSEFNPANPSSEIAGNIWYVTMGWVTPVGTKTGTGTASFKTSHGAVEDLVATAAPSLPSVSFPHGMFSFKITGVCPGKTVTVEIELPSAVPVGTVWWKYDNGRWHSLPNLNDNGDKVMVIQLTDGGAGDMDSVAGQITDPGGPGNPMTVGWDGSPVSRATVVAPWIALLAAMVAGVSLLVWRRRRSEV